MSDLKLVAPDQPTPLERQLLEAAANEAPSAEQRLRVRQALGLSSVPLPAPSVARAGRAATLGKAALGGTIAAALVALLLSRAGHQSAPAPRAAASVTPAPAALEPGAPAATAAIAPLPSQSVAAVAAQPNEVAPKSTPRSGARSSAPADSAADLGEQLRLIDAARSAVAAGNPGAASQALSSYSAKFPRGSFGQEAAVLHIETLDLQGNHAQASALATRFLAQYPSSPHVSLVQRIANRGP